MIYYGQNVDDLTYFTLSSRERASIDLVLIHLESLPRFLIPLSYFSKLIIVSTFYRAIYDRVKLLGQESLDCVNSHVYLYYGDIYMDIFFYDR